MKRRNRWLSNAALLSAGVAAIVLLSSLLSHTAAANALRWTAEAPERGARGWTCIAFGRLSGWTSYTGGRRATKDAARRSALAYCRQRAFACQPSRCMVN